MQVKFYSVDAFEYTPASALFDVLDINLVHGWLFDREDAVTVAAIGQ